MTDLVVNHAANDGRLARERPDLFVKDEAGRPASPYAVDPDDPSKRTIWGIWPSSTTIPSRPGRADPDLGRLRRAAPGPRRRGLPVRCRLQGAAGGLARPDRGAPRGATTPACSPPRRWAAPSRRPAPPRAPASTTCSTPSRGGTSRPAGRSSNTSACGRWRPPSPSRRTTTWPASPPDAAGGPEAVAERLRNRYALAAFFSAGVLMPIGYEWGYARALHVVETTPADRETESGLDISRSIAAIDALGPSCRPPMSRARSCASPRRTSTRGAGPLRYRPPGLGPARGAGALQSAPERAGRCRGADRPHRRPARALRRPHARGRADRLPCRQRHRPRAGELRILRGRRPRGGDGIRSRGRPNGEGRVVIEAVSPEIDGGRSP